MRTTDRSSTLAPPRPTVRPGRLQLWRAAWRMFAAHPIAGVGPDNFRLVYGGYLGLANTDERTHSNNMYIEMLAGGGLLVAGAFGWLAWRSAACAIGLAAIPPGAGGAGAALALGLSAALVAIGVHASVDSFLSFTPTYVLFALTLGCAAACARRTGDRAACASRLTAPRFVPDARASATTPSTCCTISRGRRSTTS